MLYYRDVSIDGLDTVMSYLLELKLYVTHVISNKSRV